MTYHPEAAKLAKVAFDLWTNGDGKGALALYQEAIRLAPPAQAADYHGQLASVLSRMERHEEAREHYRTALALESQADPTGRGKPVVVARYFLAEHYLHRQEPGLALRTAEQDYPDCGELPWLLQYIRAIALSALGKDDEAKTSARRTLEQAPSPKKRQDLLALFAEKNMRV